MLVTQAGRVLFIVPLRYLFAIGLQYIMDEHQYLAFDVSLPPHNNLSCSPKQLDSDNWHLNWRAIFICTQNVTVTLYGARKIRIPTKLDFQRTKKKRKKERKRNTPSKEKVNLNQEDCNRANQYAQKIKKKKKKKEESAMLQFHLADILGEHATRTDYHCGLNQSKNTRK